MASEDGVELVELRVLDGPNLYFTRPAVKLTIDARVWLELPDERAAALAARAGIEDQALILDVVDVSRAKVIPSLLGDLF